MLSDLLSAILNLPYSQASCMLLRRGYVSDINAEAAAEPHSRGGASRQVVTSATLTTYRGVSSIYTAFTLQPRYVMSEH
jgi:hypothetical protein